MKGKKNKSKTSKTSGVKQRNRLRNKGKIKVKRHVHKNIFAPIDANHGKERSAPKEVEAEDVLDMLGKKDIKHMKKSALRPGYNLIKQIRINGHSQKSQKKNSHSAAKPELEDDYEESDLPRKFEQNTKMLLPIKTKEGLVRRYTEITDSGDYLNDEENDEDERIQKKAQTTHWIGADDDQSQAIDLNEPISVAKILARREDIVKKYKLRIGLLSSGLLENPEMKIGHLKHLLEIMGRKEPELQITVKKLAALSLMEVFKDLLPAYQIKHQDLPFNKLKKVTKELVGYESQLLKGYKEFLTKLEKMASCLRKKRGDHRVISKQQIGLGTLAVRCLAELLGTHPYFNYSTNIVQLLTLYLDNPDPEVRKIVEECYKTIFREDKKGTISLTIVRRINHLVKSRAHSVHSEVLTVLLALKIKDINLDQEKEDEIQNKKLHAKKMKALSLSKRERKRNKQLRRVENEMLEAKAEEGKKSKQQHLTEITKLVFLIYFRILKTAPKSNLLSVTLEGLAKFAHCINLEYYQDLMNVLDNLLEKEPLNTKEQLFCVKTVFVILSGYGDALNIDPAHFYAHLYRILISINAGKNHDSMGIVLGTLENVLVRRHKKVTTQRMLSFTKRLATVCLQLLHNSALGSLSIIRSIIEVTKTADLLLDAEASYGQGMYNAELNEPEYCNAGNTSLWELCALQRHYHPTVRQLARHVASGAPLVGDAVISNELMKMSASQFYEVYDPSDVAFKPSIPPPKAALKNKAAKGYAKPEESPWIKQISTVLSRVGESNCSSVLG